MTDTARYNLTRRHIPARASDITKMNSDKQWQLLKLVEGYTMKQIIKINWHEPLPWNRANHLTMQYRVGNVGKMKEMVAAVDATDEVKASWYDASGNLQIERLPAYLAQKISVDFND
jgi:hypothetical protein